MRLTSGEAMTRCCPVPLDVRRLSVSSARAIEAIIHCGAISGPMLARGQPITIVDTNIAATARLLDIARRLNLRRFVFCSSIGVYGNVGEGLIGEEIPLKPTSVYGASKVAAEALVRAFVAEYGLSATSLRPSRVYGPYRRASCFIRDMVRDAMAGRTTLIPCDPAFLFHYVYVDDVAGALVAALEADHLPHLAYNVDGGTPMTMPEIVAIARAALPGARIELTPGSDEVSDAAGRFDIGRIAADLGWRPRFDLADGIRAYAANMPGPAMARHVRRIARLPAREDGENEVVGPGRRRHLNADPAGVLGHRDRDIGRRRADEIGPGAEHRVPARADRLAGDRLRERLVRLPGQRRGRRAQHHVEAREKNAPPRRRMSAMPSSAAT